MNKIIKSLSVLCVVLYCLSSCGSVKDLAYFQSDSKNIEKQIIQDNPSVHESLIRNKDIVTVSIGTINKETASIFNIPNTYVSSTGYANGVGYPSYIVDNKGEINLPVLGSVQIAGLSEQVAGEKIKQQLMEKYLKEVISVDVRIINYQVSILGEVTRPGRYPVENGKVNIFQALSLAGDMTIYGDRKEVKLLRELENGNKEVITLDLNNIDIVNSPYFYLQQGDVLYVQPNKARAQSSGISSGTTIWFSVVSVLTSVATLLVSVLRK